MRKARWKQIIEEQIYLAHIGKISMEYTDEIAVFERILLFNRIQSIKNEQMKEEENRMKEMQAKSETIRRSKK